MRPAAAGRRAPGPAAELQPDGQAPGQRPAAGLPGSRPEQGPAEAGVPRRRAAVTGWLPWAPAAGWEGPPPRGVAEAEER
jgi:hypothetical protein